MEALHTETFSINSEPMSINRMYYANPAHGKTKQASDWAYRIFHLLDNKIDLAKFERLRTLFDANKHFYSIDIVHYFPRSKLITKAGVISNRAPDVTNVEKPLVDLLFLPDHFDKQAPYGLKNLNIDDRYLCDLKSSKRISDDYRIDITIKLHALDLITSDLL